MSSYPRRGEIYIARLPSQPSDSCIQTGTRPVLIIQNNLGNKHSPTVTVVPLTSRSKGSHLPTHTIIDNCKKLSIALAEQVMTIDKFLLISGPVAKVTEENLARIDESLAIHLGMNVDSYLRF